MAARHIHTNRAVYSASNVREALAQAKDALECLLSKLKIEAA